LGEKDGERKVGLGKGMWVKGGFEKRFLGGEGKRVGRGKRGGSTLNKEGRFVLEWPLVT